ncbi:prolipoprotein diacylglyceryl transferase [Actinoallomurus spadix]|uniref:Phosphatidylglycerol--prolipoprotein diacylglyceryl transferase n=1 Tax=Actinoallomurus spadix TaxID=79912 RepID=A0ABN0W2E8_9ACTN|nr:prolipoprotein diacylglyceryl transferase [Actinoallomurus spadix]MCO5985462.1 prolipoprotein diacylglyceryl transferase [Actinoallomurus spadix]
MQQPLAFIPSPSQGSIHLGPLPLRGYALMIIIGVIVAVWLGDRRWAARGGTAGTVLDIAVWAVPFGLIGGRLYHVITDHQLYFGHGRHPIDALKVWNGGLGIWGAIALGTFGAYLGCRRRGISLRVFADAAAPGIALAQAIGRWGNWFNQELYGRPSKLPWAVKIDSAHRPPDAKYADIATYQPTFLYEFLWCIGVAILVIWAEKRFRLAYGRAFALYVAAYTVGRAWIEWLRIDEAHRILGLRLNDWTCLIVFLGAVAYLYVKRGTANPPGALGTAGDAGETAEDPPAPAAADDDATATAATAQPADTEAGAEPAEATEATEATGEPATPDAEPVASDKAAGAPATGDAADAEPATPESAETTHAEPAGPAGAAPADAEANPAEPEDDEPAEVKDTEVKDTKAEEATAEDSEENGGEDDEAGGEEPGDGGRTESAAGPVDTADRSSATHGA